MLHKIIGMEQYLADVRELVDSGMSHTIEILSQLVSVESVSWESFDPAEGIRCAEAIRDLAAGLDFFDSIEIATAPISGQSVQGRPAVLAKKESRNGAPTILLYAHSDVQPPGERALWNTDPFIATRIGERLYGRGAADDKAGVVSHLESIRVLNALLPESDVGIVLFVEGEEEAGSPSFDSFLEKFREQLRADVIIVADSTNYSDTIPALTTSLRGNITMNVTVSTLDHSVHSGMYGGAIPDAFMAFSKLIADCYDESGSCVIPALAGEVQNTPPYDEEAFRLESGILDGVQFVGQNSLLNRLWNEPTLTVTGMDITPVAQASNALVPQVTGRLSFRVPPHVSAKEAVSGVIDFLRQHVPFGAQFEVADINTGEGYLCREGTDANLMRRAMSTAWERASVDIGVGGSIPFIASFANAFPSASVLVTGVEDPDSRAHSPNESLHLGAFRKALVSQSLFLLEMGRNRNN